MVASLSPSSCLCLASMSSISSSFMIFSFCSWENCSSATERARRSVSALVKLDSSCFARESLTAEKKVFYPSKPRLKQFPFILWAFINQAMTLCHWHNLKWLNLSVTSGTTVNFHDLLLQYWKCCFKKYVNLKSTFTLFCLFEEDFFVCRLQPHSPFLYVFCDSLLQRFVRLILLVALLLQLMDLCFVKRLWWKTNTWSFLGQDKIKITFNVVDALLFGMNKRLTVNCCSASRWSFSSLNWPSVSCFSLKWNQKSMSWGIQKHDSIFRNGAIWPA